MSLSVCILVGPLEDRLAEAVASVADIADQLVLVSSHETPPAELPGDRVHVPWTDDFAASRNAGLAACTADWILMLDADEVLSPKSIPALKALTQTPADGPVSYQVRILNRMDQSEMEHRVARLFSRHPDGHYIYPIHEQYVCLGLRYDRADAVQLLHFGYLSAETARKDKLARNERLLRKALAQEPENPYHHFNLAQVQRGQGELQAAIDTLLRCRNLCGYQRIVPLFLSTAYVQLMALARELKQIDRGLDFALWGSPVCQHHPDFWIELGCLHLEDHDVQMALYAFEQAAECIPDCASYDIASRTWRPFLGMADVYTHARLWDRAQLCLEFAEMMGAPGSVLETRAAYLEPLIARPLVRACSAATQD